MPINIRHINNYSRNRLSRFAIKKHIIKEKHIDRMDRAEIKDRIIDHLNDSATLIQKTFRGFLSRRFCNDLKTQIIPQKAEPYNNETLLGESIYDIPEYYIYTLDRYVFDIREIKHMNKNPYTNSPFDEKTMSQIRRIVDYLYYSKIPIDIENNIPISSELTAITSSFFNRLTELKSYPDMELFVSFNPTKLLYYFNYIAKFEVIKEVIYLGDIMEIQRLYRACSSDSIDIFDDNGDMIDEECAKIDANISAFRYFLVHILMVILNYNDDQSETRALILAESIRNDIIDAYNNKDYRNYL